MTGFPQIAVHVGMAEFTLREKIAGPDDDEDDDNG
jgi:hypothetical protein